MKILLMTALIFLVNVAYASSHIKVSGLVYQEAFYEEPNYGDTPNTDHIANACMLKLDNPIPPKNNKLLQLIFSTESKLHCSQWIGHQVTVEGNLSDSITGHQHGDGILDVLIVKITR